MKLEEYQMFEVRDAAFKHLDENYYLPDTAEGELYDLLEKMEAELPPDLKSNFNEVYDEAEYNLVNNLVNEYESAHPDMVHT